MNDLFGGLAGDGSAAPPPGGSVAPLADRLRPSRLRDLVGQEKILSGGAPLARMIERHRLSSLILWGPPGCGKTTLARMLAREVGELLIPLSAVLSGVADLRRAFQEARKIRARGGRPILFIDEIHRYNKAQQDGLLHEVEDGTVTLVGATTENPSFALNPALISRCHVLVMERLSHDALQELVKRAETELGQVLPLTDEARLRLVELADGDGRYLLNMLESIADLPDEPVLDVEGLAAVLQRRVPVYDRQYEAHYNLVSALHKSIRGSDPDAALYWLCRMLQGGEDPRFIGRRLVRMAAEDIGLADPDSVARALAAVEAYERLGSPEGELMLGQCAVELALAPKSNAVYVAMKSAMASAREHGSLMPPAHILNAPTSLMKEIGYGRGYQYDHDAPDRFSGQNYFPEGMDRQCYYRPTEEGFEASLGERIEELERMRRERQR
ncbi:MAG: replication-associated recombination protein A [Geminicoccaceae bacterium]|nr:replication-associated recombination protein A [Geminicoccaceae bacterium]